MFVVGKDLFAQLVDKLIETEVHFSFYFVVEELFTENCQCIMSGIIVQIQREKYAPGKIQN